MVTGNGVHRVEHSGKEHVLPFFAVGHIAIPVVIVHAEPENQAPATGKLLPQIRVSQQRFQGIAASLQKKPLLRGNGQGRQAAVAGADELVPVRRKGPELRLDLPAEKVVVAFIGCPQEVIHGDARPADKGLYEYPGGPGAEHRPACLGDPGGGEDLQHRPTGGVIIEGGDQALLGVFRAGTGRLLAIHPSTPPQRGCCGNGGRAPGTGRSPAPLRRQRA